MDGWSLFGCKDYRPANQLCDWVVVAAEQAPAIHEGQLEIEINNIALVEKSDILAAILDEAVAQIRKQNEPEERQVYLERAVASVPDYEPADQDEPQGPGP